MPRPSGTAAPPAGRPPAGRALMPFAWVAWTLGGALALAGCERQAMPGADPPARASTPPVTTRGPDDAALTTADVTRSPAAAPGAAPAEAHWRRALAQGEEATLTLPADAGTGELPPEAATQLDALARLLDAERDWRLAISVEQASVPPAEGAADELQRAQAFRLALLARGVAANRVQAAPAVRPHAAPRAGTVRVRLRRLPAAGRPAPAARQWS